VLGLPVRRHAGNVQAAGTARRVLYYVDPMHPAYKSDRPGTAPDCGMQLEPVYSDEGAHASGSGMPAQSAPGAVNIDFRQQQLIGMRIATVEKASGTRTLRIPGRVAADETRVYRVKVGVDGFVRETRHDVLGSYVRKGQKLAIVYSPDFDSSAASYISALEQGSALAGLRGFTSVQNLPDRLRALGMSDAQIQEISSTRRIPQDFYLVAPADGFIVSRNISMGETFDRQTEFYRIADLSRVWIVADLLGNEAEYFRPGVVARVTVPNPKRAFTARVCDILPQVDPSSRTLKLRLEADSKNYALRPDMYVDVDLTVATPPALSVPADAVLDSGLTRRVFVERGNGIFEPREVEIGWRSGERVEVLHGLQPGEHVVASAAFLVDSESRLKAPKFGSPAQNRVEMPAGGAEHRAAAKTAKDPNCGMMVDAAEATASGNTLADHGITYYFCSQHCRDKFQKK
jgi:Cu(I)/Ag(I) efflux system membrane fusion protein